MPNDPIKNIKILVAIFAILEIAFIGFLILWLVSLQTTLNSLQSDDSPKVELDAVSKLAASQIAISSFPVASWYDYSLPGAPDYSKLHATAASRDYPKGTYLLVENIETGATVTVRVNDYIEHPDRDIDLSSYAFAQIAPLSQGLANVHITPLTK